MNYTSTLTAFHLLHNMRTSTKKKTSSLSQSKVKEISLRTIKGYDKWFRMMQGVASTLERYEEGIMYLRIENTETAIPSNYDTAIEFSRKWLEWNKELRHAKGFIVLYYKTKSTGILVNAVGTKGVMSALVKEVDKIKSPDKEEPELINIFSGLLNQRPNKKR